MLFKNSVHTSKRTPHFTITKINWLTLFKFNKITKPPVWGGQGPYKVYRTTDDDDDHDHDDDETYKIKG
jgi:hypothetical protein